MRPLVERGRRAAQRVSHWIRPWQAWTGAHHPVLADLEPWSGETDGTWVYDALGVRTDPRYRAQFRPQPKGRVETKHPAPFAPYFELVFVLEAVRAAKPGQPFEMVELGAGYGAWLATVFKAAERFGVREVRLTGIEMVPQHVAWMKEHLRNNGADPDEHRILHGAVSDVDGTAVYLPGTEADFGQRVRQRRAGIGARQDGVGIRVPCWSLESLLKEHLRVCLIHCDIQGEEGRVFRPAVELVKRKVERLLISTHSNSIHRDLRRRFRAAGFETVYDFPVRSRVRTEYGDVQFLDGLLCLINPHLS